MLEVSLEAVSAFSLLLSNALLTPPAISTDCSSILVNTAHVSQSNQPPAEPA